jgi:hypothetical protein
MLRVHELTHFGTPARVATPELPSAALAGAAWTQTSADPFFAEVEPAAMGYRKAPKGFADQAAQPRERAQRQKEAAPAISMAAAGRALVRFAGGSHRPRPVGA